VPSSSGSSSLLCLLQLLHPEDDGTVVLQNFGKYPLSDTALLPRRPESSAVPPWEPEILGARKYIIPINIYPQT
jgi:hypothetical protein